MAIPFAALASALPAVAGLFGGSGYQRPAGTIGTDQVLKMLKQGMSLEQIMQLGPMSSRFMANANRKLTKAGLDQDQIAALYGGGSAGAGPGGGPMGMSAFQAMLPAIMGNQSAFINPAASQWLQSMFPAPPAPAPAAPHAPIPLGMPGGFNPWRGFSGKATPGPEANPMLGLQALAGPFGNGGGPVSPNMRGLSSVRSSLR